MQKFLLIYNIIRMKRSFSILVMGALVMFNVLAANAQKSKTFAGTVKYSFKYEGDTDPKKHIPMDIMLTIFGNKMKIYQSPMVLQILDGDAGTITVLVDIPGNKIGTIVPKEQNEEKFEAYKYTYVKGEETKTICGYVCTRYDATVYDIEEEEETKIIFYTTTEIGENDNINRFEYPGLTGFPLYAEFEEHGVKTIQAAVEVKPTKVKAVDFLIPSAYNIMSPEEFGSYIKALQEGSAK